MSSTPSLGTGHPIDVAKLIEGRALIQANSGGGKSWVVRRLCEQTWGHVPQIIIDPEGEYHTLREQFDYVLAGAIAADCPADCKSAALLARRLLELGVSAVVDISELGPQRPRFVQLFLESLMAAPRELWHPLLVVIDEASTFAPEKGQGDVCSTTAVIDLMTRGRKRGFAGVLAAQRLSMLHKSAAAECNNKLIGRTIMDVDRKRAASELGFSSKDDVNGLRLLKPGMFYAFGPALSEAVELVKIGSVTTTHIRAGDRAVPPTPPRDKVRKILAKLGDLPQQAAAEARTAADLRNVIANLETELRRAKVAQPVPAPVTTLVDKPVVLDKDIARLEKLFKKSEDIALQIGSISDDVNSNAEKIGALLRDARAMSRLVVDIRPESRTPARAPTQAPRVVPRSDQEVVRATGTKLPEGEAIILRALIQHHAGLQRDQLAVLCGYKKSSRDTYLHRLRAKGLVAITASGHLVATDAGVAALPDAAPLPTGHALQAYWRERLPSGEWHVLQTVISEHPDLCSRDAISERTGYKKSSRDTYLHRLGKRRLVEFVGRGSVQASPTLFGVS